MGHNKRAMVLIVDDDETIRGIGREYMDDLGCDVVEASSGEEALQVLAADLRPDVILMDVVMGGIDGFQTTEAIRAKPEFALVPILFMTACDDMDSIRRAYAVGATDFTIKPINWVILTERVRFALRVVDMMDQQKELLSELQRSQDRETIATLLGGMAHDFNNVLQAIRGTAQLIQRRIPDDSDSYTDLDRMISAVDSGSKLIRQLLAHGRHTAPSPETIDLNHQVNSVHALLHRALPSNIRVVIDLTEEELWILADPVQLERVLINLAMNARDAMPDGGALHISTAAGAQSTTVKIADTGQGMDQQTLARIFEPYFSTKSNDKGSGLGLSMVQEIVKGLDGEIFCHSKPGHGTTFSIRLPAVLPVIQQGQSTA